MKADRARTDADLIAELLQSVPFLCSEIMYSIA